MIPDLLRLFGALDVLNWTIVAASLANTVLLLWLGFTILLNAERRTWGIWLISAGLLTGGAFFVSHTAILGHGLTSLDQGLDFWWHLGLLAAISLPFVWYVVILWYTGFWEDRWSALYRRQRFWFALNVLATLALGGLLTFANPFPSYAQVIALQLSSTPTVGGIPILILAYPACTVLNIALSLDALWHPGPSRRIMGQSARQRARPWLVATSAMLLIVGLLVAVVMLWVVLNAHRTGPIDVRSDSRTSFGPSVEALVSYFDLLISGSIMAAVLLLGQAVAHYEVFTGKTLPQRRFMRHWHNVVIMALGYGATMSAALELRVHPIYSILLSALMVTAFYSLFSRSSYIERERYIRHLRPFVLSQRLYDQLVSGSAPAELDVSQPFHALCSEILGARLAYLVALGPLAPLVGPGLAYPAPGKVPPLSLIDLSARFASPQTMCIPLEAGHYGGATWAIPLWSERGLIGALLLGEKRNGGLYTQEEIEIARASGERLIDTQASAEMSRRLMALQRQRLMESQVVDRRTRRMLHDDVLPRIHTAMLTLSAGKNDPGGAVQLLADIHRQIADLLHEMPTGVAPEVAHAGLIGALRKSVDSELGNDFDGVEWRIEPAAEAEAQHMPLLAAEVTYYAAREAIRNAGRYGRGEQAGRPLHLCVEAAFRDGLVLTIEDDGIGIEPTGTASNGGSGHGLALHSTMMAVVGGSLTVESLPGKYTRVSLTLPPAVRQAGSPSLPSGEGARG